MRDIDCLSRLSGGETAVTLAPCPCRRRPGRWRPWGALRLDEGATGGLLFLGGELFTTRTGTRRACPRGTSRPLEYCTAGLGRWASLGAGLRGWPSGRNKAEDLQRRRVGVGCGCPPLVGGTSDFLPVEGGAN